MNVRGWGALGAGAAVGAALAAFEWWQMGKLADAVRDGFRTAELPDFYAPQPRPRPAEPGGAT